jgi:hypothetical protein
LKGFTKEKKKESSGGHAFVFVIQHVQYVHPTHSKILLIK